MNDSLNNNHRRSDHINNIKFSPLESHIPSNDTKPSSSENNDKVQYNKLKYIITVFQFQGITSTLLLAVLAAISGTSFHFGYATGVM